LILPSLKEIGIEVVIKTNLPKVDEAFGEYLAQMKEAGSIARAKPTADQAKVEKLFPAIARYVRSYGHIEIGDRERFGFVVRAIGYGGLDFEDDTTETLAEAMAVLEAGLTRWFEEQGVELR
jgi:hypothetical protein